MTHGSWIAGLYLGYQSIKHIIVNLFYSKRHFVLFAIGVLADGAVVVGGGQIYYSLDWLLTLPDRSDFSGIT